MTTRKQFKMPSGELYVFAEQLIQVYETNEKPNGANYPIKQYPKLSFTGWVSRYFACQNWKSTAIPRLTINQGREVAKVVVHLKLETICLH